MQTVEVLIMGAGMSGLCMASQLKQAGQHDFVLLEKSAGLGGTWWDNRYPGAHVDVPAPLYSFSFAPNPRWQRRFAAAAEIQAYMQDLAARFELQPHLRLGHQVKSAHFDAGRGLWQVDCTDASGQALVFEARFFVCSTGPLSQARWPDITHLKRFGGRLLHSARWDPQLALAGQRVGVIGTGSSAVQLVPPLAQAAQTLTVFQRTANWVMPRMDRRYNALDAWVAGQPLLNRAVRKGWFEVLEWARRGFDEGSTARSTLQRVAQSHLWRQVRDETLRARLQPSDPFGCKRIVYSNDYFPALGRPNTQLVTERIERATQKGLITQDGRLHELDVLVCATGFDVQHSLSVSISVPGGTLASAWAQGPEAHLGLTVAGFPNLFLMLGPNTTTGHTSTLLYIEPGVRWALRAMAEVQQRGQRWIEVKPSVMQAFNSGLQQRLQGAVWSQCRSWYQSDSGKNIAIWPGFTNEYVAAVAAQDFEAEFEFG